MDKEGKLIAACWSMWSAIQQAKEVNPYNENITALYKIANAAMVRAEELETGCDGEIRK